jgi:hypothetical protein
MTPVQPQHPLLDNVLSFHGDAESYHVSGAVSESGAKVISKWSDGLPFVVVLDEHPMVQRGRIVTLNFVPSRTPDAETLELLCNAMRFVAHPTYQDASVAYLTGCQDHGWEKASAPTLRHPYQHHQPHQLISPMESVLFKTYLRTGTSKRWVAYARLIFWLIA